MNKELRILLLEDLATDAELVEREIKQSGISCLFKCVDTREAFGEALVEFSPDLILSDYRLPSFDGLSALAVVKEAFPDIPFIFVSGTIGEDAAVETLKQGATDYVLKDRLGRLAHSVRRALNEADDRRQRKEAEQALQETNYRLETAISKLQAAQARMIQQERLRALGTMASGIAHDFNNALSPILGFSELLLLPDETLEDKAKIRHALRTINTLAWDASRVVSRLREFYRTRDRRDLLEPVELQPLIEQVISLTKPRWRDQALSRGINIELATELRDLPLIPGNPSELRELLTNLIFNAVDAMPKGGTIRLSARPGPDCVILEVGDAGTGMTEEVLKHCFDPFYTTKGEEGTGMGLAMAFGIVKRHEGTIDVRSRPGEGTTFTISLPIRRPAPKAPSQGCPQEAPPSLRVLVVDDEPLVREIVVKYLERDGHRTEEAKDGIEALQKFNAIWFDLVITDRAMPGLPGDHLAALIKRHAPDRPVILLTGFGEMMLAAEERPPGIDLIVNKPVTMDQLRNAIARITRAKRDAGPSSTPS